MSGNVKNCDKYNILQNLTALVIMSSGAYTELLVLMGTAWYSSTRGCSLASDNIFVG